MSAVFDFRVRLLTVFVCFLFVRSFFVVSMRSVSMFCLQFCFDLLMGFYSEQHLIELCLGRFLMFAVALFRPESNPKPCHEMHDVYTVTPN